MELISCSRSVRVGHMNEALYGGLRSPVDETRGWSQGWRKAKNNFGGTDLCCSLSV